MWHVWGRGEEGCMQGCGGETGDHLEELGLDGRIIIK
jgi:hypothetical protein